MYCTTYTSVDAEFQDFCFYQKCVIFGIFKQFVSSLYKALVWYWHKSPQSTCIFNKILNGVTDLKEQLERSKQHVTEYQTMADNLQKALSEQSEVHYL